MITIFAPLLEWVLGDDHRDNTRVPDTLGSWNNLAMSDLAAGKPARAIPLFKRTLADCERVLGADHPDTKAARENLAALPAAADASGGRGRPGNR